MTLFPVSSGIIKLPDLVEMVETIILFELVATVSSKSSLSTFRSVDLIGTRDALSR